MYAKLALRNVKRSFKDYAIYFLTLMFGVCIFYVFNSIESQQAMMELNESQHLMIETINFLMGYASVFVSVILGFLIVYANRFLIKRRKKELGIYQTLGMEKGQISIIINIETLLVAVISLAVGLALGVFLSQGFAVITASLFDVKLKNFTFIFSFAAMVKTIIYFGITFVLVMLLSSLEIGRQKLVNLIYADRKNERFKTPHLAISIVIFILSVITLLVAYYLINETGFTLAGTKFWSSITLGIIGTFLFFLSLSGFLLKIIQSNKKLYLKNLNMFVVRQINSKIGTTYISISMVCLMLFVCICTLSVGIGISKAMTAQLESLTPYDVSYHYMLLGDDGKSVDVDIKEQFESKGVDFSSFAKEVAEIDYYGKDMSIMLNGKNVNLDFVKLSDYNKLLVMQGKEPITLGENEFVVNCNITEMQQWYVDYFADNNVFEVDGKPLNFTGLLENAIQNSTSPSSVSEFIVNDDVILSTDTVRRNILIINYIESTPQYESMANEHLSKPPYLPGQEDFGYQLSHSTKTNAYQDVKSTSVTMTYLGVYIGIVFMMISAAVLAITQLSEATDNKKRYTLIKRLGADDRMISKALFMQILVYFAAPLLLAIVHSIVGIYVVNKEVQLISEMSIMRDSLMTFVVLTVIYGGYFLATYFGSKRIAILNSN